MCYNNGWQRNRRQADLHGTGFSIIEIDIFLTKS